MVRGFTPRDPYRPYKLDKKKQTKNKVFTFTIYDRVPRKKKGGERIWIHWTAWKCNSHPHVHIYSNRYLFE